MPDNGEHAIDRRDRELKEKQAELKRRKEYRERLKKDRTTLLKLPEFQRVMADIVARSGLFQSVMTGNSMTYHKSGRQDYGREILQDYLEIDQDKAFDLLKPKLMEN